MNQHSKRSGQSHGNSVDEVRRGPTRPAAVVAIVLCVGFAIAMGGIWSCGKPPSHQETQTQPEATVQTETPNPETDAQEPEAFPRVSLQDGEECLEPSPAKPVPQASPAARQLMDGNSPAPVQGDHINSPTP